jgi:hypothetical protein
MELSALARASDAKLILPHVAFPLRREVRSSTRAQSCDTTMAQSLDTTMAQLSALASRPAPTTSPQQATEARFRV